MDLVDGYIHLSTGEQVVSTAALKFKGYTDLVLLTFDTAALDEAGEVRMEEAEPPPGADNSTKRAGEFPHWYAAGRRQDASGSAWVPSSLGVPLTALARPPTRLPLGADGAHVFPPFVAPTTTTDGSGGGGGSGDPIAAGHFRQKYNAGCDNEQTGGEPIFLSSTTMKV